VKQSGESNEGYPFYTITYCYNASVFDDENAEMGSDDEQIQLTE